MIIVSAWQQNGISRELNNSTEMWVKKKKTDEEGKKKTLDTFRKMIIQCLMIYNYCLTFSALRQVGFPEGMVAMRRGSG